MLYVVAAACCAIGLSATALPVRAQTGLGPISVENWLDFQKNSNDSEQWKYQPRLLVPWRFDNGLTFTQRVDVPLLYTNDSGAGNPGGGWTGGLGNVFIEEILESPDVAPNLRLKGSVRFVFPTGKPSPFGSSQYQWAPGVGLVYAMPEVGGGVTLAPFARYFSGFAPTRGDVALVRKLELYPAASIGLADQWSLLLYPDNPITYNEQKRAWFVPFDFLLSHKFDRTFELGLGGAWKLGNPSDPSYDYIIDARLAVTF